MMWHTFQVMIVRGCCFCRIRSCGRLAAETHLNLEVIWLLRRLQPNFKTVADFRRDNRDAFRHLFRDFVRLRRELDLYGREHMAVDGTRIKAVNNANRNFTQAKLERELKSAEERLDTGATPSSVRTVPPCQSPEAA